MQIEVPRDRDGSFEPQLVPKHQRTFAGFDDKIIAMYARGMTVRDIREQLEELYDVDVSPDLISRVTDGVLDELRVWQSRPLEPVYCIVYLDALVVKIRTKAGVRNRAIYIAVGVPSEGTRQVLGLWIQDTEGAAFWTSILEELRQRGVEDVLVLCSDGLAGMSEACEAIFPRAVFQTCIVHVVRSSTPVRRLEGSQGRLRRPPARFTRPSTPRRPRPRSRPSRRNGTASTRPWRARGATDGTTSSPSSPTPPRSVGRSTPPMPSRRSTESCARR